MGHLSRTRTEFGISPPLRRVWRPRQEPGPGASAAGLGALLLVAALEELIYRGFLVQALFLLRGLLVPLVRLAITGLFAAHHA
jgi:membrane protease YdiL (CAAX protease family)